VQKWISARKRPKDRLFECTKVDSGANERHKNRLFDSAKWILVAERVTKAVSLSVQKLIFFYRREPQILSCRSHKTVSGFSCQSESQKRKSPVGRTKEDFGTKDIQNPSV
jgi:hypothetical protein